MSKSQLAFRLLRSGLGRRSPRVAVASDSLSGHQLVNAVRRVSTHGLPIDSEHTAKWMTNFEKKSPMELIAEIPPVEVHARVVACEGGRDPALGHPIEYISLDLEAPAICKYCGLRGFMEARIQNLNRTLLEKKATENFSEILQELLIFEAQKCSD